jgi:hypothetical protein
MKTRDNDGSSYGDCHDGNEVGKKLLVVDAEVDRERMGYPR